VLRLSQGERWFGDAAVAVVARAGGTEFEGDGERQPGCELAGQLGGHGTEEGARALGPVIGQVQDPRHHATRHPPACASGESSSASALSKSPASIHERASW